jgi:hypothetical protein
MPTISQIKTIQLGRRCCDLNDTAYRTLLRNVAGVESSKALDNRGVEDVLAVMEDLGFDSHPGGETYWRDKVRARGQFCGERMAHKIHALAAEISYEAGSLARRLSGGRTDVVEQLDPHEAWAVIEAMKAIADRQAPAAV